jgi:predicted nucleic acid-binding protein
MTPRSLNDLPSGSDVFIDANVFVYGLNGKSAQCKSLLERCSREDIVGISLFEIVSEATHKFMLAEALSKGIITKERASDLRKHFAIIPTLHSYWQDTERILSLNLLILGTDEPTVRAAHTERQIAGLLTNDSMIVACMRSLGISRLATNDGDFMRVQGIEIFQPDDL